MNRILSSLTVILLATFLLPPYLRAVEIVGQQIKANEWTYDLTFAPLDNYSIFQHNTTITLDGLYGATAAAGPTSTDWPYSWEDAINRDWTAEVLNGGTEVQWTHVGGGTGNWTVDRHIYGFQVFANGATDGLVSLTTSGFSRDVNNPLPDGTFNVDIAGSVAGPVGVPEPSTWASAISGNWSDSTKWTNGVVPNAVGAGAVINAPTAIALTINLDSPKTVGTLVLGNSYGSTVGYTLSGSGSNTLTLNNSGSGATITVTDGSHVIDAPVILADNLAVTTGSTNAWTLRFSAASSITDNGFGYSLTMSGAGGTLILSGSNTYTGGTFVTAGVLEVTDPDAIPDGTSLTVGAGGTSIFDRSVATPIASAAPSPNAVLEPSTLALMVVAVLATSRYHWRRKGKR